MEVWEIYTKDNKSILKRENVGNDPTPYIVATDWNHDCKNANWSYASYFSKPYDAIIKVFEGNVEDIKTNTFLLFNDLSKKYIYYSSLYDFIKDYNNYNIAFLPCRSNVITPLEQIFITNNTIKENYLDTPVIISSYEEMENNDFSYTYSLKLYITDRDSINKINALFYGVHKTSSVINDLISANKYFYDNYNNIDKNTKDLITDLFLIIK